MESYFGRHRWCRALRSFRTIGIQKLHFCSSQRVRSPLHHCGISFSRDMEVYIRFMCILILCLMDLFLSGQFSMEEESEARYVPSLMLYVLKKFLAFHWFLFSFHFYYGYVVQLIILRDTYFPFPCGPRPSGKASFTTHNHIFILFHFCVV